MKTKIEELLNLKPIAEYKEDEASQTDASEDSSIEEDIEASQSSIRAIDNTIDIITAALPQVRDLESSDKEMDDIAVLATDTFNELVSLSMNVEAKFSGPILAAASTILGHAVTAKMAKVDKKLRMVDLQLKKLRIEMSEQNKNPAEIEGTGEVVDRNELLKQILAANKAPQG